MAENEKLVNQVNELKKKTKEDEQLYLKKEEVLIREKAMIQMKNNDEIFAQQISAQRLKIETIESELNSKTIIFEEKEKALEYQIAKLNSQLLKLNTDELEDVKKKIDNEDERNNENRFINQNILISNLEKQIVVQNLEIKRLLSEFEINNKKTEELTNKIMELNNEQGKLKSINLSMIENVLLFF